MNHHQRIMAARREAIEWIRSGRLDLAEVAIREAERALFEAEQERQFRNGAMPSFVLGREKKTTKTRRHEGVKGVGGVKVGMGIRGSDN